MCLFCSQVWFYRELFFYTWRGGCLAPQGCNPSVSVFLWLTYLLPLRRGSAQQLRQHLENKKLNIIIKSLKEDPVIEPYFWYNMFNSQFSAFPELLSRCFQECHRCYHSVTGQRIYKLEIAKFISSRVYFLLPLLLLCRSGACVKPRMSPSKHCTCCLIRCKCSNKIMPILYKWICWKLFFSGPLVREIGNF